MLSLTRVMAKKSSLISGVHKLLYILLNPYIITLSIIAIIALWCCLNTKAMLVAHRNIPFHRKDAATLRPKGWLNDNVRPRPDSSSWHLKLLNSWHVRACSHKQEDACTFSFAGYQYLFSDAFAKD